MFPSLSIYCFCWLTYESHIFLCCALFSSIRCAALGDRHLRHVPLPWHWPVPSVWAAGERLPHGPTGGLPREGLWAHDGLWVARCTSPEYDQRHSVLLQGLFLKSHVLFFLSGWRWNPSERPSFAETHQAFETMFQESSISDGQCCCPLYPSHLNLRVWKCTKSCFGFLLNLDYFNF